MGIKQIKQSQLVSASASPNLAIQYQRSFRQTLDDGEVSTDSDTEASWSVLDDIVDESIHPTASNGRTASGIRMRDETFVKTSEWLQVIAHLDFEPLNRNQPSLGPNDIEDEAAFSHDMNTELNLKVTRWSPKSQKHQDKAHGDAKATEARDQPAELGNLCNNQGNKTGWLRRLPRPGHCIKKELAAHITKLKGIQGKKSDSSAI